MNDDYSKRDYLLPKGCNDLIDILKLQAHKIAPEPLKPNPLTFAPVAAMTGELLLPAHTTVLQLYSDAAKEKADADHFRPDGNGNLRSHY